MALAGWKGYVTSLDKDKISGHEIIDLYHDLYHIEQSFRMARTDLRARPMFHWSEQSIHAHLVVVLAALAMSKHIYNVTGMTAPKLIEELEPYKHATIKIGNTITQIPPFIAPKNLEIISKLKNPIDSETNHII